MKTSVIPAQITTIEDKIAGNLNLTQIILLLGTLVLATIIYAVFPPSMNFSLYKLPLIIISSLICLSLALRIKNKVVLEWVLILLRFNLRPRFYLYDKNDLYLRNVIEDEKISILKLATKEEQTKVTITRPDMDMSELIKMKAALVNPKYRFSFKFGRKGGLNVAVSEV